MRVNGNGYGYQRLQNPLDTSSRAERMATIKKQISEGTYQPDKYEVAKKILQSADARKNIGFDEKV